VFAESGKSYFPDYVKRRQEFTVQGRFRAAILGSRKVIYTPGLEDDAWEFYDLGRDPAETENLWETHGDAVQDVRAALRAWSKLDGAVDDGEEISPDDLEILRSLGYVDDR